MKIKLNGQTHSIELRKINGIFSLWIRSRGKKPRQISSSYTDENAKKVYISNEAENKKLLAALTKAGVITPEKKTIVLHSVTITDEAIKEYVSTFKGVKL